MVKPSILASIKPNRQPQVGGGVSSNTQKPSLIMDRGRLPRQPRAGVLAPAIGAVSGAQKGVIGRRSRPSKALQGKVRNVFSTNKY